MQNLLVSFCEDNNLLISENFLNFKTDELIPLWEWVALLEEINRQYSKPGLGLEISKYVEPRTFGILGYLLLSCNSLLEALNLFKKYQRLALEIKDANFIFKRESIVIHWGKESCLKNNQLIDELLMAILVSVLNQLVYPNKISINRIRLSSTKKRLLYIYEAFFGCPVEFLNEGASLEISLNSIFLLIPSADPLLNNILIKQADLRLAKFSNLDNFYELLTENILQAIKSGDVNLGYVANKLGITSRMLQSKMKKRGYNFKEILNVIRKEMAFDYLLDEKLSILDVSELLGYREQTSFIRAFKGWTGVSPLRYRKTNVKGDN